ncbi:MAG: sugar isomerase [Planctomycetes bacterium]|nr:sugar isomerase [Planctomycetota bacterium]
MKVKPILVYSTPRRRHQSSWRSWGGIQTEQDARKEVNKIQSELRELRAKADFPVDFQPVSRIRGKGDLASVNDLDKADVIMIYAAGGGMDTFDELAKTGKDIIFFCRHKSGPVYLWYEIISPRYLRQHTDTLAVKGIDDGDVVIDSQDEIMWRLRALCGLRNTMGTRIIAIGGPGAWAQPRGVVPELVRQKWQFDMKTVSYDELGKLIKEARADQNAVKRAKNRAGRYLKLRGTTLETERQLVDNCFLLEQVFHGIMKKADCQAITINGCMGTIIPIAETTACLTLSLLNDAGYLAFCESDFVVIPSGVLLANISGIPVFLNDPTYPHDGLITLAHCTAPRRMDGKKLEPARIMTHFESDYGAAPKVEMHTGQIVTNIVPDFNIKRWVGLVGEIVDAPFMDVCRSQIDISFSCDSQKLAERMPGFHWMTCYGDYMRELGYALKKVEIEWENLTA